MKKSILLVTASMFLIGCASSPIKQGMSKEQVLQAWGEPTAIRNNKNSCCREKGEEAWHYFDSNALFSSQEKSVVFKGEEVKYVFRY
ncbi:MAG: hypothetical protein HQL27_01280 [Candidatus Omnitrophica bacterium]|nr:hypothetical protein [Candidatus Omnitrophota bacterium]